MGRLQDFLNKPEPKPIGKINGKDVYTFADEVEMGDRRNAEEKLGGKVEFGQRQTREGGLSYASSSIKSVATNPTNLYLNRYRVVEENGKKVYQIVAQMFGNDDYRVIKEQASGRIFTNNVVVHLVGQGDKKGTLKALGTDIVSDDVFAKEFVRELNQATMQQVFELYKDVNIEETTKDSFEF